MPWVHGMLLQKTGKSIERTKLDISNRERYLSIYLSIYRFIYLSIR